MLSRDFRSRMLFVVNTFEKDYNHVEIRYNKLKRLQKRYKSQIITAKTLSPANYYQREEKYRRAASKCRRKLTSAKKAYTEGSVYLACSVLCDCALHDLMKLQRQIENFIIHILGSRMTNRYSRCIKVTNQIIINHKKGK